MLIALVSADAHAQTTDLAYDLRVDIPVTAAAMTWVIVSQLASDELAPTQARWCDCHSDGSDALNGLDSAARDAFRWDDTSTANTLSDVMGYALAPVVALGSIAWAAHQHDVLENFPIDALIIVEALMLAEALVQLLKPLAARERPFVHSLSEADKALTADPLDNNMSFYSAHASWTFALASAAGTVATLRRYRFAPWIWAAGMTVATFVGYSRIAADHHYLTDVLVGAAMGTGIGFAIPYFFHRASEAAGPQLRVAGLPGGAYLTVSWVE